MTIIRTSCPTCGTVNLTEVEMRLLEVPSVDPWEVTQTYCVFDCPRCGQHVRRAIDELTTQSLLHAGVRYGRGVGHAPSSSRHPENPPEGPPLTLDDLLDLHLLLQEDDWYERCVSAVR